MPVSAFDDAVSIVLKHEGALFTDDPNDHGGATKYGITYKDLLSYHANASVDDLRYLTEDQAKDIYLNIYWIPNKFDSLPEGIIQICLFDQCVLCGVNGTIARLQTVLGIAPDGLIGPATAHAIDVCNSRVVAVEFLCAQQEHLWSICKSSSQQSFFAGWLARTQDLLKMCV